MKDNRIDNWIFFVLIIIVLYCIFTFNKSGNVIDDYPTNNYYSDNNYYDYYNTNNYNDYYNTNNYNDYLDTYDNYLNDVESTYEPYMHIDTSVPVQGNYDIQNTTTYESPVDTSSSHLKYYYNQLDSTQQKLYQTIEKGCLDYKKTIKTDNASLEDVTVAAYAVSMDHPEIFWINKYNFKVLNNKYVVEIEYDIPSNAVELSQKIDAKVLEIINDMSSKNIYTEYDKLKYFYDWIINNTEYGDTSDAQEITSVLINNTSVCSGYSKAFLYLCQKVDIECVYVAGYTKNTERHAWNLVRLGENYYWVDTTWGDPVFAGEKDKKPNYNYFLVDDEEFLKNHVVETKLLMDSSTYVNKSFTYPSCRDKSMNYYRRNGSYFDDYYQYDMSNYLKNKFRNNIYTDIELKFSNKSDFDAFLDDFIRSQDAQIYKDFKEVNPYFYGTIYISYETIEKANYAKISVTYE